MKTLSTTYTASNRMRTIIAGLSLAIAVFGAGSASAQNVKLTDNSMLHIHTNDAFKVAVFPVENSSLMKVLFENPTQSKVTMLIKNSKNEVVYTKAIGNGSKFNGKFDVSQMGDGIYTMVIQSSSESYTNTFAVETREERIAKAL
ncbi:hypothetical protein GXP67_04390 [Rhodocytophaga rosea]|uniref:T9SS type A sorting domain-containing protein n=1 Tax=Rhodocytophaga rosea TaxID=2704465 RepID=A0A6C0GDD0_9BACT|nr:hypothetical protein [Rhodocytophaga rosea]QHT65961.1 hypothetical protein GXP67_04390 [Rhodocytophaga rosea]